MNSAKDNLDRSQHPYDDRSHRRRVDSDVDNLRCGDSGIHDRHSSCLKPAEPPPQHRGYQIQNTHHRNSYSSTNAKRFRRDEEWNRGTNSNRYRGYSDDVTREGYYGTSNHGSTGSNHINSTVHRQWKCLECSAWNDDGNIKCLRCHAKPLSQNDRSSYDEPFDKEYHRTSRYRGSSKEDIGNDSNEHRHRRIATNDGIPSSDTNNATAADLDEFGRVRSQQPKKTRWPPCFETHGSSFVLDTRSGMFYESISDFFYDPKSKLYYGNKQSAYFQYDPIKRSFIDLSENKSKAAERESPPAASGVELQPAIQPSEVKKTSITIKLKTKLLTSTTASKRKKDNGSLKEKPKSVVPEPVAVPKQHAINIEKWSERQNEIRQQAEDVKSKLEGDEKTKIVATAKGEPICLLCRRRFPNVDKLRHHEEVSTLHKENLAKQASLSNEKKQESSNVTSTNIPSPIVSSATYIDRAEQRRQLHQLDQTKVSCLRTLNSDVHSIVSADNTLSSNSDRLVETRNGSNSTLDESNIGHQMLQKLGWKSGNLVGKKSDDNHVRIADDNGRQAVSASTTSRIEQDWDRIEAVSKLTSSQRGSSMQIGGKKGIGL